MSRGRDAEVRDPAIAIAAGKCWLARWNDGSFLRVPNTSFHPQECGFCDVPDSTLMKMLNEFLDWANLRPSNQMDDVSALRAEIEMFQTLPVDEQKRLVAKAQGYVHDDDDDDRRSSRD